MKILCRQDSGKRFRQLSGFGKVFSDIGCDFIFWNGEKKSTFDAFYEQNPDIYICSTSDVDTALIKCLKKHSNTKVILIGSFSHEEVSNEKFAKVNEIENVKTMFNEIGKPDLIIGNCSSFTFDKCMSVWKNLGCNTIASPVASDFYLSVNPLVAEKFVSDVVHVGNFTDYKSKDLEEILFPLHYDDSINLKIFGKKEWPLTSYVGFINNYDLKNVIKSSKICAVISKPHTKKFGFDAPQFLFDVLSSGGFPICDYSEDANFLLGDYLLLAKNKDEYLNMVHDMLKQDVKRDEMSSIARSFILNNHTYHHRLIDILININMEDLAIKISDNFLKRKGD